MKLANCLAAVLVLGAGAVGCEAAQPAPSAARAVDQRARDNAIDVLIDASVSDNPYLRANAIEAMQMLPQRALPVTHKGLSDASEVVRFAAVVTAGQLKLESLTPAIEPLIDDEDPSVRGAAIFAMHALGKKVDLTPLADLLESRDPNVRGDLATIIGLLGDPSAIPMLKQAADVPMPRVSGERVAVVRVQIAEAAARLGDEAAINALRASARSSVGEVQVLAIKAIGAVGDEMGAAALQTLLAHPWVEVKLATAETLARIGRQSRLNTAALRGWLGRVEPRARAVVMAEVGHEMDAVRAQAAWALGWFDDPATMQQLAKMAKDRSTVVRLHVATSIVRRTQSRGPAVARSDRGG